MGLRRSSSLVGLRNVPVHIPAEARGSDCQHATHGGAVGWGATCGFVCRVTVRGSGSGLDMLRVADGMMKVDPSISSVKIICVRTRLWSAGRINAVHRMTRRTAVAAKIEALRGSAEAHADLAAETRPLGEAEGEVQHVVLLICRQEPSH